MATTTAAPLDARAEAKAAKKAAKKKEPKPSFSERWLDSQGWSRRVPLLPALVFKVRGENCINTHRIEAIDAPDYSGTMHAADKNACFISLPTIRVTASRE